MNRWFVPVLAVLLLISAIALFVPSPLPTADREALPQENTPLSRPDKPLARFLEDASIALVLRSPETVTYLGLAEALGTRNDQLTPLSVEYEQGDVQLLDSILAQLDTYDLSLAAPSDRLSARVYGRALRDWRESSVFSDHDYLVSSYFTSYPDDLEWFMTYIHPLENRQDVEDYLSRLSQIDDRFDELVTRLRISESINAVPPRFILEEAAASLHAIAAEKAQETSYHAALAERLPETGIDPSAQAAFLTQADAILGNEVLPAYAALATFIDALAERASEDIGVWKHVDGDAYYAFCLQHYTTTSLSADRIHALGLSEVTRIREEIYDAASTLGYDRELPLPVLYARLTAETGAVRGQETVDLCQALIDDIIDRVRPVFARWPQETLVVVEGEEDAFFSPGSLDGSRPGMFFAPSALDSPVYSLPTLTYHEAIPGHFLQTAFAHEANIPTYRMDLGFTAYSEGWALYAERLAWELGAYENNPRGNLGRLQDELFRAVRLVVDTGIHAMHWTYDQAVSYMRENTGLDESYVRQEVDRYIVTPGQATAYKIGMLKLLELRDRAQTALGDAFDLATFHSVILDQGEIPLDILEERVDAYIAEQRS